MCLTSPVLQYGTLPSRQRYWRWYFQTCNQDAFVRGENDEEGEKSSPGSEESVQVK